MQQNKDGEQKLFRLFGRFNLIFLFCVTLTHAESFADFKNSQEKSFAKYADERDNGFRDYLNEQFKEYKAHIGTPLYEEPKPKTIAPAEPREVIPVGPKIFIKFEPTQEQNTTVTPQLSGVKKELNFDFYGSMLAFHADAKIRGANFYPKNQAGIGSFFNTLASSEYKPLLADINAVTDEMQLNDWGVYLLVEKISGTLFPDEDKSNLFAWFIFNKLGYNVKVGLANGHIVMMHYSEKNIYNISNFRFSDKKFYVLSDYSNGSIGSLYSYDKSYPGADKALDLSLHTLPKLKQNIKSKTLKFIYNTKEMRINYEYNKNLIDFMESYPQADYETYFNAPLEEKTYISIAKELKKEIDAQEASVGMNFVLKFVQNAFKYERDSEQFGKEKVMFAQETLFYDKSDCEDRSILFASLIKELFKVPVIGIKYKDHMATGLYVPMFGDSVNAGNRRFVIADPTYINATIGQSMPKYKPLRPESFIIVRND